MKKIFLFTLLITFLTIFISCNKDRSTKVRVVTNSTIDASGAFYVEELNKEDIFYIDKCVIKYDLPVLISFRDNHLEDQMIFVDKSTELIRILLTENGSIVDQW